MQALEKELREGASALLIVENGVHPVVIGRTWPGGAFLQNTEPTLEQGVGFTLQLSGGRRLAGVVVQTFASAESEMPGYVVRLTSETEVLQPKRARALAPEPANDFDAIVVDDDRTTARLIARWLEDFGHTVQTCGTAKECLDVVHEGIDTIIVDSILPGMNGVELVRALRERGSTARIVSISGRATSPMAQSVLRKAGSNAFLAKPLQADDIKALVGNKSQLRRRVCRYRDV